MNYRRNKVKLKIYKSFSEISHLKDKWDSFINEIEGEIFLTFDWSRIWWKYYGDKRSLYILVLSIDDNIVGILPIFIEKLWSGLGFVRTAKIVGSDYTITQFHMPVFEKYIDEFNKHIISFIKDNRISVMYLGPIAGKDAKMDIFIESINKIAINDYGLTVKRQQVNTYFIIEKEWKDYLQKIKKKERVDIKRNYNYTKKLLNNDQLNIHVNLTNQKDIKNNYEEFVEMHQSQWQKVHRPGHFADWPYSKEFHYELMNTFLSKDQLRLMQINIGPYCAGYEYIYKCGNRYYEFLNARTNNEIFKHVSVGKIIFSEMIKNAIKENISYVDSMRGKYEQKIRLGGEMHIMPEIYIYSKNKFSYINYKLLCLSSKIVNFIYYKLWYITVARKIKIKKRQLIKLWIRRYAFSG